MRKSFNLRCFFSPLDSSFFSILQILGNILRGNPGEDDSSSPIHYSSVFSHSELDVAYEYLPRSAVFEIQALVVTQMMRILNFFALNLGSPCCTQSSIIFSELNFHLEKLVELFVQGVLGDLVHQNGILCESEENDSKYCSFDFSLTSTLNTDHRTFSFLSLSV